MMTRFSSRASALACCAGALATNLSAAPDVPAPASPDVPALIRQLGDADFRQREAASQKLKDIGKPAEPALREALSGTDPEVCARADALLRQLERPRIPAGWFRQFNNWRRRESNLGGTRVIDVEQSGRRVRVVEGAAGIEMTVTGVDDGHSVNVTLRARDADDLRRQDAEAYEIYQRVAGPRSNFNLRGRGLIVPEMQIPLRPAPQIRVAPRAGARLLPLAPPEGLLRPPADDLLDLETRLRKQMRAAGVAPVEQQAVLEAIRLLRDIQTQGRMSTPLELEAQIRKYNELSDALRQKLEDLKLPGPGDALPPPARARLGVSVAAPGSNEALPGGVTVTLVIPQSRGEKLGLKAADVIRRVNGKAVDDAAALRRVLTDTKDALVLDVVRGGEPVTLREPVQKP